jgi:hypothetical protein
MKKMVQIRVFATLREIMEKEQELEVTPRRHRLRYPGRPDQTA